MAQPYTLWGWGAAPAYRLRGCSRAAAGGRPNRRSLCRAEQTCELRNGPTRSEAKGQPQKKEIEKINN